MTDPVAGRHKDWCVTFSPFEADAVEPCDCGFEASAEAVTAERQRIREAVKAELAGPLDVKLQFDAGSKWAYQSVLAIIDGEQP